MITYVTSTIINTCIAAVFSLFYVYMFGEIIHNGNLFEEFLIFFVPFQLATTAYLSYKELTKR